MMFLWKSSDVESWFFNPLAQTEPKFLVQQAALQGDMQSLMPSPVILHAGCSAAWL